MKEQFEIAGGSVIGREHLRSGKNNQDAYWGICSADYAIAVVCDGCGSRAHSEVGAKIGARLTVEALASCAKKITIDDSFFWQQVQQDLLKKLQALACIMGGNFSQTLQDYFLFTIVGALVTPAGAWLFSIGDGIIAVNGTVTQLGPFPQNTPPYLAYGLLDSTSEAWQFQIHKTLPLDEVKSILIGTDGVKNFIEAAETNLPGKEEKVGSISQFWEQDCYFKNPDSVRRKLALMNREVTKPDWEGQQLVRTVGLLPDDTTLMVLRKRV
ncbi:MAG: protein phosphatase 2C domain-containing protein [Oscillatoriaceae bacterium SKW80]|nr:protein phosphatase 2C domain-containing protein [Oscillatoriaceae bacterium SKYG93]MCX8120934.1 protein phosphatase 2C domain-containing protein [Oscillatoriaceae bacterium SKW80]MDW8452207.1 protein phosphatase 2C domain-containing protein [Oscillatoriaceae cyanobacterium SKYGB_i_bin93]HIK26542.1 protein phosphatase 2C domain-containing protein [Oscillatoriaceae cyanobacterium M7585_C2015_266]